MPHLKINSKLAPLLTKHKPFKVAIGGRMSGKSTGFGDIFAMKMRTEGADIYCLREFQDSIKQSVHRVIEESVRDRLQLEGFDIQRDTIIDRVTGASTMYKGANRNPDSIQSAQGYKYSWVEEAQTTSEESLDKLIPTILRNKGAECWFSANPQSSADAFSQRFIVPFLGELLTNGYYEDDMHVIVVINWRDNPWWSEEQEKLRAHDFNTMPRAKYDWIWEGKFNDSVDGSIIKPEWFDAAIDAHKLDRLKVAMEPRGFKIASFDPCDGGADAHGYTLRHGSIIKRCIERKGGEIDEGCDWATGMANQDGADVFTWDGDGPGSGLKRQVADAFKGRRTSHYIFKGSLSGSGMDDAMKIYLPVEDKELRDQRNQTYAHTFKNNRARYYTQLQNKFYNTYRCVVKGLYIDPVDMISIDSDGVESMDKLRAEVCRVPEKANNVGLIQIMSKQDMLKLKIKSPNMADTLMMSEFAPPPKASPASLTIPRGPSFGRR